MQRRNRRLIPLRRAPRIHVIPHVVAKVHRHLGNPVVVLQQIAAYSLALDQRIALFQKRIPKPAPVAMRIHLAQQRFVLCNICDVRLRRNLIQRRMRPRMTAQRIARRDPLPQQLRLVRKPSGTKPIHKPIHRRHLLRLKRLQDDTDRLRTKLPRRQRPMRRQVVKRKRHLQVWCTRRRCLRRLTIYLLPADPQTARQRHPHHSRPPSPLHAFQCTARANRRRPPRNH